MRAARSWALILPFLLVTSELPGLAQSEKPADDALAQDLKLLQGKWEMLHGNEGRGDPTIRSVKEIEGNRETLRRYDALTGQLTHEHFVEFALSRSGDVRVCTFFSVGGD